jgi:hypothetical protein
MPHALAYFELQTNLQLDFSRESLATLEQWLLARYPDSKAILSTGEEDYLDAAARYIGETFRHHVGGKWNITFDNPTNISNGIPEVTDFPHGWPPICPLRLVTATLGRRTGTYLQTILNNMMANRKGANKTA